MNKTVMVFVFVVFFIVTQGVSAKEGSRVVSFAKTLPGFSLRDPAGNTFTSGSLLTEGLVLVVTAPIFKNKGAQEGWNKYLSKTRAGCKAKWAYLEDITPSFFKGTVIRRMKKEYEFGKEPILLIDNKGVTRVALKVPKKQTVILVYSRDGRLVHSETGKPSALAAKTIWKKVKN